MHRSTLLLRRLVPAVLLALLGLAGCGGSSNSIVSPPGDDPTDPGEPPPVAIADLSLIASSTQLPSDGSASVTVSAIVRDANNTVVEGQTVVFSATSGALQILNSVTNEDGVAQARLSLAGDPTNRAITVTATAGSLTESIDITVFGTTLTVTGPTSVVFNDTVQYTVRLQNSGGNGISGRSVDVSSGNGNTLSAGTLTTNSEGEATVSLTGTVAGDDTLTATALGLSASQALNVSNDSFAFLTPSAGQEITLGTVQDVTVEWLVGGTPQSGTVNFLTTRGTLSAGSAVLDGNGRATVTITSNNSGVATITATASGAPTIQRQVEFVATDPAKISVQASRFTVGPGEQSTVTATVRDANDNLVKNAFVVFELEDVTGGSLSLAGQTTNSFGQARTVYTAGNVVSASGGVVIRAFVQSAPAVTGQVALTVAQEEVDIAIGTDNTIQEQIPDYIKTFSVRVTDSQGVGIEGVDVQLSVFSRRYFKGIYVADQVNNVWVPQYNALCADEDTNRNGQLDPGEDVNGSGSIEAGFVAAVSPGTVTTGANGAANFQLSYAQEFGSWVEVTIQARASVTGTEFLEQQNFVLSISQADAALSQSPPGGITSRWGSSSSCFDTN